MAMAWLGNIVSISRGDSLDVYHGRVSRVDWVSQSISLTQPFHNGVKCLLPEVTFRVDDITELKILEIPDTRHNQHFGDLHQTEVGHSGVAYQVGINQSGTGHVDKKPAYFTNAAQKITKRSYVKSQDVANSQQQQCSKSSSVDKHMESLSQSKSFSPRDNSWSSSTRQTNQATSKKGGLKNGQMKKKDDGCFGENTEDVPDAEFDLEGSLAIFDKAVVFEEIDMDARRSGTCSLGIPKKRLAGYHHDQNILASEPIVYPQIAVPHKASKEFCTDSGLMVPSVSYELHQKLLSVAEKHGLTLEQRLEMTGVCASQLALSLLGEPNRWKPKSVQQRPTVALLCGPHLKGAQGISCARHLANHDVQVILFLHKFVKMQEFINNELSLFGKTQGQQISSHRNLPTSPVDLIINCLDCPEKAFLRDQPWYKAAVDWANQNRAPVLSIDPPVYEAELGNDAKWSLALGLPLPLGKHAGHVYLCDIGIPQQVFQEVGINYHSPFGNKLVIPLKSAYRP